jgi:pimeloyl-ACP methyl ester carboxylesterase
MNVLEVLTNRIFSKLALVADSREYAKPELFGLVASTIETKRRDGTVLRGYKVPTSDPHGNAPTVVFFAGNTGNVSAHFPYIEMLHRAGCNVLALDYGGYGLSDGRTDFSKLLDDAHAACDAARHEFGGGAQSFQLGLFGLSIGANIALAVSGQRSDILGIAVEGLSILREVIRGITLDGRAGPRHVTCLTMDGEDLPERESIKFPGIRGPGPIAAGLSALSAYSYPFAGKDPRQDADRVSAPVLVAHGTTDRIFPFEGAVEIYKHCPPGSRLWLLPDIGHAQEPALNMDEEYVAQLRNFYGSCGSPTPEVNVSSSAAGTYTFQLDDAQEPGAFLITLLGKTRLDYHRAWLEPGDSFCISHKDPQLLTTALRMHCVERLGRGWEPVSSKRAGLFESIYGDHLRQLSRYLHAAKVEPGAHELTAFASLDPPFPFSHIGALHAARLESLARKKNPEIAEQARGLFVRFQNTATIADCESRIDSGRIADCGLRTAD